MILPISKILDHLHAGLVGPSVNALEDDVAGRGQVDAGGVGDVNVEDEVVVLTGLDVLDERDTDVAVVVTLLVILDVALVPSQLGALAV